ncbi:relaxase/mobilization nuclease domain-containing protein [Scytonema hofmannii FACHB-248]|uniref:Relaxase/mobilization nuclease domain-containing protein n=2 Tax=Scytonema hofmannii TaxID=34078 RepID=A0ABR8GLN6_9CYAN|nr:MULTISPECIES: relaxase/mobilization nuclease domain-containing protein [Nostocales]MBD2604126.1 relaxase/mobilization nuclease domain-containing protein [Scytonema hofmannii FACHB-248]
MISVIYKKADFLDTLNYVLKKEDAVLVSTNMAGKTVADFNQQFLDTKYANKKTSRQCAHLIISIAHRENYHEHLDNSQYSYVAEEYLKEMGYLPNKGENSVASQFVAVRHQDRNHEHLHIITSRIKLDGTTVSDSYDYFKAQEITRRLSAELGLEITPTSNDAIARKLQSEYGITVLTSPNRSKSIREVNSKHSTPGAKEIIRGAIAQAIQGQPTASEYVQRLEENNIRVLPKFQGKELLGFTYVQENVLIAGYQVSKNYSLPKLKSEFGLSYKRERDYTKLSAIRSQSLLYVAAIPKKKKKGKKAQQEETFKPLNGNDGDNSSDEIITSINSAIAQALTCQFATDEQHQLGNTPTPVIANLVATRKDKAKQQQMVADTNAIQSPTSTSTDSDNKDTSSQNETGEDKQLEQMPILVAELKLLDDSENKKTTHTSLSSKSNNSQPENSLATSSYENEEKLPLPIEKTIKAASTISPDEIQPEPTEEDKSWAEGILPAVGKIWQKANQTGRIKLMPEAGEQVEGRDYRITIKDKKLSILSIKDNREVALYDLGKNTVLTTNPTDEDKQYWEKIAQKQLVSNKKKDVEFS